MARVGSKAMAAQLSEQSLPIDQRSSPNPPLKWAGGKRWLVPALEVLYAPYKDLRLVEPFAGGLAVALGLQPRKALLGDLNPHAINFYRWLQRGLKTTLLMRNNRAAYDRMRRKFNRLIERKEYESAEAAALFYYLNRTGFNGLCRFNSEGKFNVPFGSYSTIRYQRDFSAYRPVFRSWKFQQGDFSKLKPGAGDFVYADPPYDVEFTRYAARDFTWEDQVRLAGWLSKLPGPVVASNQATPRIVSLYREHGFTVMQVSAPRMISCTGDRSRVQEMLAVRNIPSTLCARAVRMVR